MAVWSWCVLIIALFLVNLGWIWTAYICLCFLGLGFGAVSFFYSKTNGPLTEYFHLKQRSRCLPKTGIRNIIEQIEVNRNPNRKPDQRVTGCQPVDEIIQDIFRYLLNDYVYSWWDPLSNDEEFVIAVRGYMQKLVIAIAAEIKNVSFSNYITTELLDNLTSHIRMYRVACEKAKIDIEAKKTPMTLDTFKSATQGSHSRNNSDGGKSHSRNSSTGEKEGRLDLESAFFQLEVEAGLNSKEFIATSREMEKKYLEAVVDSILYQILPTVDFNCLSVRLLVREILLGAVVVPIFDMLSDPYYINLGLIMITNDVSLSADAFLTSVKTTPHRDELLELQEIIRQKGCEGSGSENDVNTQLQLTGFKYLLRILEARLQGGLYKDKNPDDKSKIVLLKLNVILKHHLAQSYFIDFLSTVNMEKYIFLYVSIESWVLSAKSDKSNEGLTRKLRESAQQICKQFLIDKSSTGNLVPMPSHIVDALLLKLSKEPVNESWFNDVIEHVLKNLDSTLEDFYKSNIYMKLLSELDLLKDNENDDDTQSPDSLSLVEGLEDEEIKKKLDVSKINFELKADIVDCSVVQDKGKTYGIYALSVIKTFENGTIEKWPVYRRYSDFYDFHQKVRKIYSGFEKIPFPAKKAFNNMEPSILTKRMKMLQDYLQIVLSNCDRYPELKRKLLIFLEPGEYDKYTNPLTSTIESVKGSVRHVTEAVKAMPDNFFSNVDGFSKVLNSPKKNIPGRGSDSNNMQLRIMHLMDEVFDLKSVNQWLRRNVLNLLRQVFGDRVNRKILKLAEELTSTTKVSSYLKMFRDYMWPGGKRAEFITSRNEQSKVLTRILARTALLTVFPDEFKSALGSDTTRRGLLRVFALFQNRTLNRRFLHVLLEGIVVLLFPNLENFCGTLASHKKDIKPPVSITNRTIN